MNYKSTILSASALLLGVFSSMAATPVPSDDKQQQYVIVLSMDGFRHDLPEHCNTPTLDSLKKAGVYTDVYPSFPANTFPNHYAMATGLYPDHHGVVNNTFYDKRAKAFRSVFSKDVLTENFWGGEPIWNTAERQGLTANIFMWPGSDILIGGHRPSKWMHYTPEPSYRERADWVIEAMTRPEEEIPHLVMWYFEEPDASLHHHGVFSKESIAQVEHIDSTLCYFFREIRRSPVFDRINFIVTADHGMTNLSEERRLNLYNLLDTTQVIRTVPGSPFGLEVKPEYRKEALKILRRAGHLTAWAREQIPARYHYGSREDRITNIVLLPDLGWTLDYSPAPAPLKKAAAHGFDNYNPDMHMVFFASGPAFRKDYVHKSFQNNNLYLIICHLLGIEPAPNDGEWKNIRKMFRE